MLVFPGKSFKEKFSKAKASFRDLGKLVSKKYGMEGAFIPNLKETKKALDLLMKIGKKKKAKIILDAAASHFRFKRTPAYYLDLAKEYPIFAIEDPFPQDDYQNWKRLSSKLLIIGDDLTVTNPNRIKLAHKRKACRGVVIKPNQIGTITETIEAAKLAKSYGWKIMVSHRSGETLDDFIADLAVGLGADFIKSGAPFAKERMVKYKRLERIEQEL
jgi:enolase